MLCGLPGPQSDAAARAQLELHHVLQQDKLSLTLVRTNLPPCLACMNLNPRGLRTIAARAAADREAAHSPGLASAGSNGGGAALSRLPFRRGPASPPPPFPPLRARCSCATVVVARPCSIPWCGAGPGWSWRTRAAAPSSATRCERTPSRSPRLTRRSRTNLSTTLPSAGPRSASATGG